MKSTALQFSFLVLLVLCFVHMTYAGKPAGVKSATSLAKTETNDVYQPMLINNIFNYYSNCGDGSFNSFASSAEGFEFPKGLSLATCIFEDGVVWGCYKNDSLKVGGSTYWHGLQAGQILTNGTASALPVANDPGQSEYRLYRVRPDMHPISGVTGPNDPNAAGELAVLQRDEVPLISRYQAGVTAAQLLQQYWDDWNSWPAYEGAPYTDVDHNGTYDPTIDIPGVPLAGQTMWYVANDLSITRTFNLAGSTPIGLEMQKTIWAYTIGGALSNTIFASTKLINKSGVELDSMYVAQWSDPDLGDATDDFVGCDTLLSLGYVYNGRTVDNNFQSYGLVPPAVGFDFFQGPMVKGVSTDTAIFDFKYRPGYHNLPMTSFNFFINQNPLYEDPVNADYQGTVQWYRLMKGLIGSNGIQYTNPVTNRPTPFVLSGDPVAGTGWIDGTIAGPGDRRMAMSSGPFTMMPGDTQEVVVANLASRGADYLSSITALKTDDKVAQRVYNSLFRDLPPQISCSVTTSGSQATISFKADAHIINASAITVNLRTYSDSLVAIVPLADDGNNNDGVAGDKIFGKSIQIPQQQVGLYAEVVVLYPSGDVIPWAHLVDNITTTSLTVPSYSVASDNINEDGIPNPGENVRYIFSLKNNSSLGFSNLSIKGIPSSAGQQLSLATLSGNATLSLIYNQNDPTTYMAFDVPKGYHDTTMIIVLITSDLSYNQWIDTLVFPVKPLGHNLYGTPLTHVAGKTVGNFTVWIVDSSQVKNHIYVIRGVDSIGPGPVDGYTLKDSTTGAVLIQNHPLPDVLGHTSPIVDGFKLLLGTVDTLSGMGGWSIPSGARRLSPSGGYTGLGLEGFSSPTDTTAYNQSTGTIGMGGHFTFGGIGTNLTSPSQYHTVLLKLAAVDTGTLWDPKVAPADANYSLAYRYLRHASSTPADPSFTPWIINTVGIYPYQDFNYAVPFSAWDMETTPPTRLAVGMFESNSAFASVDGRYWPPTSGGDNMVNREFCFIFSKPYSTTPDPALQIDFGGQVSTPLMWVMTCTRRNGDPWAAGDQFEIIANHPPSSNDLWVFNPSVLTTVKQASAPYSFVLMQNYPNPFNPSTTIRYELPALSKVTITIYNLLGQKVRTLVNEIQNAGPQFLVWNSKNDAGASVASGVYFYRIEAAARSGSGGVFSVTKKMVLLR